MTAKATPMQLVCSNCGVFGSIELFTNDRDAREVSAQLGKLPPDVAQLVLRYLRLHAPAKRVLTWRRARNLLDELVPLVVAGVIRRKGRDWQTPPAAWISAITKMLDNPPAELPLKGNGYLLTILMGEADKAEGIAERKGEAERVVAASAPAAKQKDAPSTSVGSLLSSMDIFKSAKAAAALLEQEAVETWPAAKALLESGGYAEPVISRAVSMWSADRSAKGSQS